jgi:hypothetical protein
MCGGTLVAQALGPVGVGASRSCRQRIAQSAALSKARERALHALLSLGHQSVVWEDSVRQWVARTA